MILLQPLDVHHRLGTLMPHMQGNDDMSDRFLRVRSIIEMTGLKRSTIYALAKAGRFPRPFKLSERSSAWSENAIREWMDSKNPIVVSQASSRSRENHQ
jgi:prophage regulatory protein